MIKITGKRKGRYMYVKYSHGKKLRIYARDKLEEKGLKYSARQGDSKVRFSYKKKK